MSHTRKVVLLGTESTGKTTLTQQLAAHFEAPCVLEAGRDLIAHSGSFTRADLLAVATEQARRIVQALKTAGPLLLIDTDVHITQSYAWFAWGEMLVVPADVYALHRADLYLYLTADVPYVQDGTRLAASERLRLDLSHRQTLAAAGVPFVEIRGTWAERFRQAAHLVEALGEGANTEKPHPEE
ncbi:AAA family ATPase [Hymenobacter psychrotolerans]|uniref:Nicotinamide riboside kinase n=1 Tax=Hymenobacter psychrotolerans DSM 18569 TaxID=1121959 RepID=A0A1M6VX81_9BACT|nr:ATP-binding protein [Hymenobacter psychrotolerans]SHK85916.1 Nicotinamide riboside kinase [Hymenobacter psychrotolerans DSM 18569]